MISFIIDTLIIIIIIIVSVDATEFHAALTVVTAKKTEIDLIKFLTIHLPRHTMTLGLSVLLLLYSCSLVVFLSSSSSSSSFVVNGFIPNSKKGTTNRIKSNNKNGSVSALFSSSSTGNEGLTRRQVGELTVAGIGLGITYLGTRESKPTDYGLWGVLPVGTYKTKKTISREIVPEQIWTFDQKFGILNVQVPLRMTVVKLSDGGLFVYNPVAATPECVDMLQGLVGKYGPIKHIVIGPSL